MSQSQSITLGLIVGNRNFFPDALVTQGRRDVLEVLAEKGVKAVILDEHTTKLGGVERWAVPEVEVPVPRSDHHEAVLKA
jgi:L-fucose isomerase-like protein